MADQHATFHPRDALANTANTTLQTTALGAVIAGVQNTLRKQNVGAMGILTRSGGTIALRRGSRLSIHTRRDQQPAPKGRLLQRSRRWIRRWMRCRHCQAKPSLHARRRSMLLHRPHCLPIHQWHARCRGYQEPGRRRWRGRAQGGAQEDPQAATLRDAPATGRGTRNLWPRLRREEAATTVGQVRHRRQGSARVQLKATHLSLEFTATNTSPQRPGLHLAHVHTISTIKLFIKIVALPLAEACGGRKPLSLNVEEKKKNIRLSYELVNIPNTDVTSHTALAMYKLGFQLSALFKAI